MNTPPAIAAKRIVLPRMVPQFVKYSAFSYSAWAASCQAPLPAPISCHLVSVPYPPPPILSRPVPTHSPSTPSPKHFTLPPPLCTALLPILSVLPPPPPLITPLLTPPSPSPLPSTLLSNHLPALKLNAAPRRTFPSQYNSFRH